MFPGIDAANSSEELSMSTSIVRQTDNRKAPYGNLMHSPLGLKTRTVISRIVLSPILTRICGRDNNNESNSSVSSNLDSNAVDEHCDIR